jgi:hypothetical protein
MDMLQHTPAITACLVGTLYGLRLALGAMGAVWADRKLTI